MTSDKEHRALADVVARLSVKFPYLEPEEIRREIESRLGAFDGVPVRDFVPILIEHETIEAIHGRRQPASD